MNWKKVTIVNYKYTIHKIYFYLQKMRIALWMQNRMLIKYRETREEKNRRTHFKDTWPCLHLAGSRNVFDCIIYAYMCTCISCVHSKISKLIMHVHLIHVLKSPGNNNRTKVSVILFPVFEIGNEPKAFNSIILWFID